MFALFNVVYGASIIMISGGGGRADFPDKKNNLILDLHGKKCSIKKFDPACSHKDQFNVV